MSLCSIALWTIKEPLTNIMNMVIIRVFNIISAILGILLVLIFLAKKVFNLYLNLFIANLSILIVILSFNLTDIGKTSTEYPLIFNIVILFILLLPTLLYLGILEIQNMKINRLNLLILIIAFAIFISETICSILNIDLFIFPLFNTKSITISFIWQNLYYLYFAIIIVYQVWKERYLENSSFNKLERKISKWISLYFLLVIVVSSISDIITTSINVTILSIALSISIFILLFILSIFSLNLIKQVEIKESKSPLQDGEEEIIMKRLFKLLEDDKIFTKAKLSLIEISKIVKTTPHRLSAAINRATDKNLNQLLNNYRLKYSLELIKNNKLTITEIAFDSGFGSISSFNTIFKKEMNISPSQYRKKLLPEL